MPHGNATGLMNGLDEHDSGDAQSLRPSELNVAIGRLRTLPKTRLCTTTRRQHRRHLPWTLQEPIGRASGQASCMPAGRKRRPPAVRRKPASVRMHAKRQLRRAVLADRARSGLLGSGRPTGTTKHLRQLPGLGEAGQRGEERAHRALVAAT